MKSRNLLLTVALLLLATGEPSRGNPLENWTWHYPHPQGLSLYAVTYGGGLFVAVGESGTIITSADGYNWTSQTWGKFPTLLGVGYADGFFAAVGAGGTILTSSNGISWVQQSWPTPSTLRAVAGNPSYSVGGRPRFLAVGDSGAAIACTDVTSWSTRNTGATNNLNAVTRMNSSYFLVVGEGGIILRSDGNTYWSPRNSGTTNSLLAVASGNYVYPAAGQLADLDSGTNYILYATNTLYWNAQTFIGDGLWFPSSLFTLRGMTFGGDRFVAVGYPDHTIGWLYPGVVMLSTNGSHWIELGYGASEYPLYAVTYGNGLFVAVGPNGAILASADGSTWSHVNGHNWTMVCAMASDGVRCIASAHPYHWWLSGYAFTDASVLVSTNGTQWTPSPALPPSMWGLVAAGDYFYGVSGNCIYSTSDGIQWATNCLPQLTNLPAPSVWAPAFGLRSIAYGGGLIFAVGEGGAIVTSSNGLDWTDRSLPVSRYFSTAVYGNGTFVAAGQSVATSKDGVSWLLSPTNPPAFVRQAVFGNGIFAGIGEGGILSSTDGQNWSLRYTRNSYYPGDIAYGNGIFLALLDGLFFFSPDGENWRAAGSSPVWLGYWWGGWGGDPAPQVCFHRGTFIIGGMAGKILQSDDTGIPIFQGSSVMPPSGFSFSFPTVSGDSYRVQATSNFQLWENAVETTGDGQPSTFTDPSAGGRYMRFFRVVSP